jgi:diguanylate cyclase (GGDEF)-like protein
MFPTVIGALQLILHASVLMVWPATALAMVMMQIVTLTEKINLDHLTGLYNRKYLDEYVDDVLQMSRAGGALRGGKKFAAIMLDIDDFKSINDTFGHVEGDHAIVLAAELLRKSIRKGDVAARYGGDEFLIVLDQCSESTPARVIRR